MHHGKIYFLESQTIIHSFFIGMIGDPHLTIPNGIIYDFNIHFVVFSGPNL